MRTKNIGFRKITGNFWLVSLNNKLRKLVEGYPGVDLANRVLCYGYIDHDAGLSLEVLALSSKDSERVHIFEPNSAISSKIRIGAIQDDNISFVEDRNGEFRKRFAPQISVLDIYAVEEDIQESRKMEVLDIYRSPEYPDDVLVYLLKEGNKPEACWVRIEGIMNNQIIGTLLNEPKQNFSYHLGEKIAFFIHKDENGDIALCSNMNPSQKITAEDLEDGTMLESSIYNFNRERNQDHFLDILEILRDSHVWILGDFVMSDTDESRMKDLIAQSEAESQSIVGNTFKTQDQCKFKPDILKYNEDLFFPVFSNPEAMGEYGNQLSKIQHHFLDVITLAEKHEQNLSGIVINAFSEPFVLDKDLWDLVKNMKSRLT